MDNYKTRITPAKEDAVKALRDEFSGYDAFIFTDYRGMTVEQITDIRKNLRKEEAAYRPRRQEPLCEDRSQGSWQGRC